MELSMEEFLGLQKCKIEDASEINTLKMRLEETIKTKNDLEAKCNYWMDRARNAETRCSAANYELFYLKTYIVLSIEKVKTFFNAIKDLQSHSLIYTFLMKTLPDKSYQQMAKTVNDIVGLPHVVPTTAITAQSIDMRGSDVDKVDFNGQINNNGGTVTGNITNNDR